MILQRATQWVAEKGGIILDDDIAPRENLWVRCAAGHEWCATITNLANKHWCAACYGNLPLTIELMQEIAENRGGKCISQVYKGSKTLLTWECAYGHRWDAAPHNIKNAGSWCPHCKINIGEELVRAALEEAFPDETFERTRRQPWMEGLELDGYNENLRLAFEYQGKQHFERVEHFQRNEGDFEAQLARDAATYERCEDEFVTLMVIPYTVGFLKIRSHVRQELLNLAYEISPATDSDSEFYDRVRARGPSTEKQYARALAVIKAKGGECLSAQYVGYTVPLRIRCGLGHEFQASLEAIDQPASRGARFCPECAGTRRRTDDELRVKVEECGYKFLGVESRRNVNKVRRYITVQCPAGHQYDVMWDNFCPTNGVPKKGCQACHHSRIGASKRNDISGWMESHGLMMVGDYKGRSVEHTWICSMGHRFNATFVSLQLRKTGACIKCWLDEFTTQNNLELQTAWTPTTKSTTPLSWKCMTCGGAFTASLMAIMRKNVLCETCV